MYTVISTMHATNVTMYTVISTVYATNVTVHTAMHDRLCVVAQTPTQPFLMHFSMKLPNWIWLHGSTRS